MKEDTQPDLANLTQMIKLWGAELGFQQVGITDIHLDKYEKRYQEWLARGLHGEMHYLSRHGTKRTRPDYLIPDTLRIISARLNYLPAETGIFKQLNNKQKAYISRYALGRDYHKVIRARLAKLANKIRMSVKQSDLNQYRVFCDSAPVLEKPIAEKAGLGWIGKHTNLINAKAGSWFFLGEIYTDLPLICDQAITRSHCGSCSACIAICPTKAIIAPYQLDARLCISYLTIELREAIPVALRPLIGNRIYGCDDCQLVCPWNKFAKFTEEKDFHPRHQLATADLLTLFAWRETDFLRYTEGSAIRRIGFAAWSRNIAVALGNAPFAYEIVQSLKVRLNDSSALVREHVAWALAQQHHRLSS